MMFIIYQKIKRLTSINHRVKPQILYYDILSRLPKTPSFKISKYQYQDYDTDSLSIMACYPIPEYFKDGIKMNKY